eukprot:2982653-Pyramimonas_sp.AAC.1
MVGSVARIIFGTGDLALLVRASSVAGCPGVDDAFRIEIAADGSATAATSQMVLRNLFRSSTLPADAARVLKATIWGHEPLENY